MLSNLIRTGTETKIPMGGYSICLETPWSLWKRLVGYTFRSSALEAETTVVLDDYTLRCRNGENEEVISYASITSVRINRLSKHVYKIYLSADGHRSMAISSQSLTEKGMMVDHSTGYSLFVRVLHRYLKDKSQAVFRSGRKWPGSDRNNKG